jgi:hypothetical protein
LAAVRDLEMLLVLMRPRCFFARALAALAGPAVSWAIGLGLGIGLVSALGSGCGEDPLTKLKPRIEVEPAEIDFGAGIVGQTNVRPLVVRNRGNGVLELRGVDVAAGAEVYNVRDPPVTVQPTSESRMSVVFVPRAAHEIDQGALLFRSNDPIRPMLRVPLHGTGGVRKIEVVPMSIDFGLVNEGSPARRSIEIRNIGGDPLDVASVTWTSTSVDMMLAPRTFTGGILAPKTSTVVEVVYAPIDLGSDRGIVTIRSDDEERPVIEVPVRGDGHLAPRAIAWGCDKPATPGHVGCDGVPTSHALTVGFRKLVGLDGRKSYDPQGAPIGTFEWRLVERAPESRSAIHYSQSDLDQRKKATADIDIDRIGRFDLRLIVKDQHGLESIDRPESHVTVTPRDLQILLHWDVPTNVDLHFVRPGGRVGDYGTRVTGTSTGADCSTYNREPHWSDRPNHAGDPELDRDDVLGTGPVIISMDNPVDGGTYQVFVHYCDSRDRHVPVKAKVEVRVRGELVATIPALGPGFALASSELWQAAALTWDASGGSPRAIVEAMTQASPVPAPRLCRIE